MKRILTLAVFFAFTSTLFAQYDKKAKEILDQVSAKTKSYKTVTINFSFLHENLQDNSKDASEGSLKLKGNKYILEFLGNTIFSNGVKLWSYVKETNEVNVGSVEDEDNSVFNPSKMLTIYEKIGRAHV